MNPARVVDQLLVFAKVQQTSAENCQDAEKPAYIHAAICQLYQALEAYLTEIAENTEHSVTLAALAEGEGALEFRLEELRQLLRTEKSWLQSLCATANTARSSNTFFAESKAVSASLIASTASLKEDDWRLIDCSQLNVIHEQFKKLVERHRNLSRED